VSDADIRAAVAAEIRMQKSTPHEDDSYQARAPPKLLSPSSQQQSYNKARNIPPKTMTLSAGEACYARKWMAAISAWSVPEPESGRLVFGLGRSRSGWGMKRRQESSCVVELNEEKEA
jgi:hypothetical protein